jgi:putative heme-binding domain-containing protein
MTFRRAASFAVLLVIVASCASAQNDADKSAKPSAAKFVKIFNGKDLTGWKGLEGFWSVKDGAIVGSAQKETSKQTFLVYTEGDVKDFELKLKFKFASTTGNSGIQFRSKVIDPATSRVGGYQADFDAGNAFTGIIYDEAGVAGGRNIMSKRGEKTWWGQDADAKKPAKTEPLEMNDAQLREVIKVGDWNDVLLTAQGNHIVYQINGHVTTDLTDDSPTALTSGVLALQMHQGFTQEIQFKDIELKTLSGPSASKERPAGNARAVTSNSVQAPASDKAPAPQWVWRKGQVKDDDVVFFRKSIPLKKQPIRAEITASADNELELYVNGKHVATNKEWSQPVVIDVTNALEIGNNVIAARAANTGSVAGFIAKLTLDYGRNDPDVIVTDTSWIMTTRQVPRWNERDFAPANWTTARVVTEAGGDPWGDLPGLAGKADVGSATAVEKLRLLPGFKAELLYSVPKSKQGSWVCMTFDDKGRIIASDQNSFLYRITLTGKPDEPVSVERLTADIGQAQGLLYHNGYLFVDVNGSAAQGSGFYRLRDTDGDDQFDEVKLLKKLKGAGEHGPHAIRRGPDGKIYFICGNHTDVPEGIASDSPHKNYAEDHLLPRMPDANGHATGRMAPGGYIIRTDENGEKFELLCGGFRNTYDFAFNPDGEMFGYDSDMEWDVGLPWYRPTRVYHLTSASEFGWRYGSGKWPAWYPDSLGAYDVGVGSPTGVEFGTHAKFPAKYQRALFIQDWAYGTIYAMHLTPKGSSYDATFEPFVQGRPLPVTDMAFGPDGAMYFTIGGRKTQSGLYRVTYAGNESTAPAPAEVDQKAAEQRALRHKLESFHGRKDPAAIDFAWNYLDSPDRALRYAARIAIEWQDVNTWSERALAETRPRAGTYALLALARCGDASLQGPLLESLDRLHSQGADESLRLDMLRVLELAFIRMGKPEPDVRAQVLARLDPLFPAASFNLNRELCDLLICLESPTVVAKAMKLMADAPTQEQQIQYFYALRNAHVGWDTKLRTDYFTWYNTTAPRSSGGNSFKGYLRNIRNEAEKTLTPEESLALADVLKAKQSVAPPAAAATAHAFVKQWTIADLAPSLDKLDRGRNFAKGREAFLAVGCGTCHKLGNQEAQVGLGPDITGVGNRFSPTDLLESIIEPSKTISDLYQTTEIRTADDVLTGRVESDNGKVVTLRTGPLTPPTTVPVDKIKTRRISPISTMPKGLLDNLKQDEILDLLAYLRAAGNPNDVAFRP